MPRLGAPGRGVDDAPRRRPGHAAGSELLAQLPRAAAQRGQAEAGPGGAQEPASGDSRLTVVV